MSRPETLRLVNLTEAETGSLEVVDGERVVLLGPSGSGKTTIVKHLLGLDRRPRDRRSSPLAATAAYVPQSDGVFLDATVIDNVRRPSPHVAEVPETEARDWLDLVGLTGLVDHPTARLSIASKRRVALARALSRRRPLLIIDGELDPTIGALLADLLGTVPHLCSILTTSCILDEWTSSADRIALVDDCRVIAQAPLSSLLASTDPAVRGCLPWVTP